MWLYPYLWVRHGEDGEHQRDENALNENGVGGWGREGHPSTPK